MQQCETVSAWHRGNDLPLLWPIHAKHRVLLFRLLDLMDVRSATQDRSLLDALAVVSSLRHARRDDVEGGLDLGFASPRWLAFVAKWRARPGLERQSGPGTLDRRALEVCVFVHLADALQTCDLFIVGAETFADYRAQLLPWAECEARLPGYCAALGISERGEDFAAALKAELATLAAAVDAGFPANTEFSVDADGTPHLKQLASAEQPAGLAEFDGEVQARMEERHLLDILRRTEHWSRYTRHFGPPSGSNPKLAQAIQRYLFTVFGYGCRCRDEKTGSPALFVLSFRHVAWRTRARRSWKSGTAIHGPFQHFQAVHLSLYGTRGPWQVERRLNGADVAAQACGKLLQRRPVGRIKNRAETLRCFPAQQGVQPLRHGDRIG